MSYLQSSGLGDMRKVVISFWFQVPSESLNAANANRPPSFDGFNVMLGVVSLLTFGKQQTGTTYSWTSEPGFPPGHGIPVMYKDVLVVGGLAPVAPSYIGIQAQGGAANLAIRVATTGNRPTVSGASWETVSIIPTIVDDGFFGYPVTSTFRDVSNITYAGEPEYWGDFASRISVTPDHWHHLLVSWDLTRSISTHGIPEGNLSKQADCTSGGGHLWVAMDDANYNGFDLPFDFVDGSRDKNLVLPHYGSIVAAQRYAIPVNDPDFISIPPALGPARYGFDSSVINSSPLGVPGQPKYATMDGVVNPIYRVDMSELQIFTGVTIDTSSEDARRAFLAPRGTPGVLIGKKVTTGNLFPVDSKVAQSYLSTQMSANQAGGLLRPKVLLHTTANWQMGKNTGTGDQFTPVGQIDKFTPDPSVEV